ncbi:UPF0748 yngK [Brachionus plicatilis]|uniref:UPF0748 yngK n=1 Tax=Brachionus plicatilis TaxID=10195 RepID=A0A3M7S595_BRAPC|nr:UPF0748 yngK [Brachionus plicatilis]
MLYLTTLILFGLINGLFCIEPCDTTAHPTYGYGKCVHTSRCPYSLYISNLCPSFPNEVKCCYSTPTDDCSNYEHPTYGFGQCVKSSSCQGLALSGYCDDYSSDYKCCFDTNLPSKNELKKCAMSLSKGKGVCVSAPKCPNALVALTNECNMDEVCCYSLQKSVDYYEFRGVWISTVANIDWPSKRTLTTEQQKSELITILNTLKLTGINAVVFQIRPAGDALYNSNIEPWSYYLTGTQGKAPSPVWDPLQFIVEEAHLRNIDVHAWFNPYRAKNKGETYTLSSNHMANRYSRYAYNYAGYLWMDPGSAQVKAHTLFVLEDILTRYDIDGLHMDDYFYPYPDNSDFPDSATYASYLSYGGTLSKSDWRRDNVNKLVKDIYSLVKRVKPLVQFGISPFGIWRPGYPSGIVGFDSYDKIFADSKKWLNEGWLDYLTPQLYWEIDPPAQSFPNLLKWWGGQNFKNKLVFSGNALYKLENNNWPSDEIRRQVEITRNYRNFSSFGAIHFTTNQVMRNVKGVRDVLKNLYSRPALTPFMNI